LIDQIVSAFSAPLVSHHASVLMGMTNEREKIYFEICELRSRLFTVHASLFTLHGT